MDEFESDSDSDFDETESEEIVEHTNAIHKSIGEIWSLMKKPLLS